MWSSSEASHWAFQDADISSWITQHHHCVVASWQDWHASWPSCCEKSQILDEAHLGGGNLEDHSVRIALVLPEMIGIVRISYNIFRISYNIARISYNIVSISYNIASSSRGNVQPNPVFPLKTPSSFWLNFSTEKWLQKTFHFWQILKIHIFPNQCLSTTHPLIITSKLKT